MKYPAAVALFLLGSTSLSQPTAFAGTDDIPVVQFYRGDDGGPIVDGLQLLANFDRMIISADKPVILRLAIYNTTQTPFTLFEDGDDASTLFQVTITDAHGNLVPLTRWGRTLRLPSAARPDSSVPMCCVGNQVRYYEILPNREFDLTERGTYRLTVIRPYIYSIGHRNTRLHSKAITFTITEPDSSITSPQSGVIVSRSGGSSLGPIIKIN